MNSQRNSTRVKAPAKTIPQITLSLHDNNVNDDLGLNLRRSKPDKNKGKKRKTSSNGN